MESHNVEQRRWLVVCRGARQDFRFFLTTPFRPLPLGIVRMDSSEILQRSDRSECIFMATFLGQLEYGDLYGEKYYLKRKTNI